MLLESRRKYSDVCPVCLNESIFFAARQKYGMNARRRRRKGVSMNRKNMPLILMLTAGAVTCIITFIKGYSVPVKLSLLFAVLLLFYVLGSVLRWTLDYFDAQNEKRRKEEGEVIEKESAEEDDGEEAPQ